MNRLLRQLAIATNWPVLAAVAVLCTLGVLGIWADTRDDAAAGMAPWEKQILFLGIGLGMLAAFQLVHYQRIGRWAWGFYLLSLTLLLYTVLPGVPRGGFLGVPEVNGAHAWIDFKLLRFQPAELAKISFVMVLAHYLRFRSNYRTLTGLLPPFALAVVPVALILKQPDLGTALVFIPVLAAMLFVAGAKLKHLLAVAGMGLALLPIIWFMGTDLPLFRHMPELVRPYQRARVYALFSESPRTLRETGFQQEYALVAFGSGGVGGKGLGNIPVGRKVPEAHNDMIFALVGEQFGFFGAATILGAYLVLFAAGTEIAAANRDPFGKLVAVGVVSVLAGQTFINLMVALRMMPVTGVTLPFVSYGGSSLLASFIAVGLLLNIGQNRPLVIARDAFEFD